MFLTDYTRLSLVSVSSATVSGVKRDKQHNTQGGFEGVGPQSAVNPARQAETRHIMAISPTPNVRKYHE